MRAGGTTLQKPESTVRDEVVEHFASLLGKDGGEDGCDYLRPSRSENVVRPAAFIRSNFDTSGGAPGDTSASSAKSTSAGPSSIRPPEHSRGDRTLPDLGSALEKIEAAGASLRLAEERANQQSLSTIEFFKVVQNKLREAEARVQDAEDRLQRSLMKMAELELAVGQAETRCETSNNLLGQVERRLRSSEECLQTALTLASDAQARCAEQTSRAENAENWMRDVFETLVAEFPDAHYGSRQEV